jgi:hypothetical protein
METGTVKDYINIGSAFASLLTLIIGTYWNFYYKIKKQDERITAIELQKKEQENYYKSVDKKLMVIERNLVKVMDKLNVEPVRDLCDE